MKQILLVPVLALASSTAACQQMSTPPASSGSASPATGQAQAAPVPPALAEFDKQMAQVQENMRKMDEQMAALRQTNDPKQKERLLQDHLTTMNGTMAMMRTMRGPGMMGGPMMGGPMMGGHMTSGSSGPGGQARGGGPGMGWHGMQGYYSRMTPEELRQRHYMHDQYMAMQQQMMDHMMQHQQWTYQTPLPQK